MATDWYKELTQASAPKYGNIVAPDVATQLRNDVFPSSEPSGFGRSFVAGLADDVKAKIDYFAKHRFPDMPIEKARQRYGIVNGDIVYLDHQPGLGTILRREESPSGKFGEWVGHSGLPVAGAIGGGILGNAPGAGVGGAAGEGWRKTLSKLFTGEEQSVRDNVRKMGWEYLLNLVPWGAGERFADNVVDRVAARDAGRINPRDVAALDAKARREGVDLTAAERTNLPSLKAQQTRLGMGFDAAGDIMGDFGARRNQQVANAVDRKIGQAPHAVEVGRNVREVMTQQIEDAMAARTAASRSSYRNLDRANPTIPDREMDRILSDDYLRELHDKVREDNLLGVMDHPPNSFRVIDEMKKELDTRINEQIRKVGPNDNRVRLMQQKRNDLLQPMENLPTYQEARAAHAGQSPYVNELQGGLEGFLSRLGDSKLESATDLLMNPRKSNPMNVRSARRAFQLAGRESDWNDLVNLWLRQNWVKASKPTLSGETLSAGPKWRQAVWGSENSRERAILREAVGPERFRSIADLMDVIEATARVPRKQSMTEPAMQAAKREEMEASPVLSIIGDSVLSPVRWRQWFINRSVDQYRADLARIITSPQSLDTLTMLRRLHGLSPNSRRARSIVAIALVQAGAAPLEAFFDPPPEQLPAAAGNQ